MIKLLLIAVSTLNNTMITIVETMTMTASFSSSTTTTKRTRRRLRRPTKKQQHQQQHRSTNTVAMVLLLLLVLLVVTTAASKTSATVTNEMFVDMTSPITAVVTAAKQERIINGQNAPEGRYPWFTRVVGTRVSDGTLRGCGGSLIAKDLVLTAAHCE
jgi:anaerobic C4-dicarboxylate transporter